MTNATGNEKPELWLIRHGETEWSLSGAHTSRTDIPLTARGEERAAKIRDYLAHRKFSLVLTSPLQRARETCRVAGYADVAQIDENLREWDYGIYEGRTTAEIRKEQPEWSIWDSPPPQGEPVEHVAARTQQVIDRAIKAADRLLCLRMHMCSGSWQRHGSACRRGRAACWRWERVR